MNFKLKRTLCQQSLKYIYLYNTEGARFSSDKGKMFLCNEDTYYYSDYYPMVIASPAETVQNWSALVRQKKDLFGASTLVGGEGGVRGHAPPGNFEM